MLWPFASHFNTASLTRYITMAFDLLQKGSGKAVNF